MKRPIYIVHGRRYHLTHYNLVGIAYRPGGPLPEEPTMRLVKHTLGSFSEGWETLEHLYCLVDYRPSGRLVYWAGTREEIIAFAHTASEVGAKPVQAEMALYERGQQGRLL